MKKVVILANSSKPAVAAAMGKLDPWLREHAQIVARIDEKTDWDGRPADFAVVVGGDGTVLLAARKLARFGLPILPVNVGKFGFLSEATAEDAQAVLAEVLAGRFQVQQRMMLHCTLQRDGKVIQETPALNDAVISRTSLSRLMTLDFMVDGELVTTYRADGLVVATPVGSTAHSLAAGGPIVYPELDAFVIAPICPHTLSNRPLVLPPDKTLEVRPRDYAEQPALTVDGQVYSVLSDGDSIVITKSKDKLRLIRTGRRTFFQTLCDKLAWSGHPQYGR